MDNDEILITDVEPKVESRRKEIEYRDPANGIVKLSLEPTTKQILKDTLQQLEGTIFKLNDLYFKVTYLNIGNGRFSATCVNHID